MRARFVGAWEPAWQRDLKIPRGHVVLRVDPRYIKAVGKFFRSLQERQDRKRARLLTKPEPGASQFVDLDVTLEIHYAERSLGQNALMWALYEVEANEKNGGVGGAQEQVTTAEELYEEDMRLYAPTVTAEIEARALESVKQIATVKRADPIPGSNGMLLVTLLLSSSHWNTVQMSEHLNRLFNRLAYSGVSVANSADLKHYWTQWKQLLADQEVELYTFEMTEEAYREATPWCEACGEFVGNGGGHIDHISTRGSGVTWGEEKRRPSDWLHLCPECHMMLRHPKGIETFARQFRHLKRKIEAALKRNIDQEGQKDGEGRSAAPEEAVQGGAERGGGNDGPHQQPVGTEAR